MSQRNVHLQGEGLVGKCGEMLTTGGFGGRAHLHLQLFYTFEIISKEDMLQSSSFLGARRKKGKQQNGSGATEG